MSIVFKDRIVEYPNRYRTTQNEDGTVTLTPAPGTVVEQGTPLNANNFNNIIEETRKPQYQIISDVVLTTETGDIIFENLDLEKYRFFKIVYILFHAKDTEWSNPYSSRLFINNLEMPIVLLSDPTYLGNSPSNISSIEFESRSVLSYYNESYSNYWFGITDERGRSYFTKANINSINSIKIEAPQQYYKFKRGSRILLLGGGINE